MRSVPVAFALLALLISSSASAQTEECRIGALRNPLQLSPEALELRSGLFTMLCKKSTTSMVDADDASLQERIVRPQLANADKVKLHDFYPADARKRGIEGRSVHLLVVESDGSISQYALVESSDSEVLDKAALTFLSAIRMTPGTFDGVPVRMTMVMPIAFKLPASRK
jgi:TonB family protein